MLRKLRDLVNAGAVVVGDRPTGSPSLADKPDEFDAVAEELWGKAAGKGKVISGKDSNQVLVSLGVVPDFEYDKTGQGMDIMFVHRHLPDSEIYFLSNRSETPQTMNAAFRITGSARNSGMRILDARSRLRFALRTGGRWCRLS